MGSKRLLGTGQLGEQSRKTQVRDGVSQWNAGTGVTPNIQPRDLGTSRVTAQSNTPPSLHFFSLLIPRLHSGLRSSPPEGSPDPSGWTWGPSLRVPPEYRCGALTNCLIDSFILLPSSQCELGCLNSSLQSQHVAQCLAHSGCLINGC